MAGAGTMVYLYAEPFGFGPAAIAAAIRMPGWTTLTAGHTHDLLGDAPCVRLDAPDARDAGRYRSAAGVDVDALLRCAERLVVVCDGAFALRGLRAGCPTTLVDPLFWFWPSIPDHYADLDLVVPRWYGVEERVAASGLSVRLVDALGEPADGTHDPTEAPLTPPSRPVASVGPRVMNLGGIANPHWSFDQSLAYARLMRDAFEPDVLLTSTAIACALGGMTLSREEVARIERGAGELIVTPGIGNVTGAASTRVPTVLCPPANDSQARQALDLAGDGWDNVCHWPDHERIDLHDQSSAMHALAERVADGAFERASARRMDGFTRFGHGGIEQIRRLLA